MFPVDFLVNVHTAKGVRSYTLLENQRDRALVVVHPDTVEPLMQCLRRGGLQDDALVALLAEEALVLDRRRGFELGDAESLRTLAASRHAPLRRAALYRRPLGARADDLSADDLAWAFGLEVARRRLGLPG
ncbi:MAG: hypothetical protein VKQ33_12680 [Candidatus Sericytochromatia bacterium]|nr:hypothetical protein [Candidatus Sericytochromatia bacterium]